MTLSKLHGNGYINYCEDCDFYTFRECNHPSFTNPREMTREENEVPIPEWCPLEDMRD